MEVTAILVTTLHYARQYMIVSRLIIIVIHVSHLATQGVHSTLTHGRRTTILIAAVMTVGATKSPARITRVARTIHAMTHGVTQSHVRFGERVLRQENRGELSSNDNRFWLFWALLNLAT